MSPSLREVLPGATGVMSNTVVTMILDRTIQDSVSRMPGMNMHFSACANRAVVVSHHHIFYNVLDYALQRLTEDKVNPAVKATDFAVFGHDVSYGKSESVLKSSDELGRGLGGQSMKDVRKIVWFVFGPPPPCSANSRNLFN